LRVFIGLSLESLDQLLFTKRTMFLLVVILEQVVSLDVLEA